MTANLHGNLEALVGLPTTSDRQLSKMLLRDVGTGKLYVQVTYHAPKSKKARRGKKSYDVMGSTKIYPATLKLTHKPI